MPAYRYVLCDLLTDQVLANLPLTGVTFDRRLSRPGALSGTLLASTPGLVTTARLVHRNAGRAALWVYRDGEIWWGGVLWSAVAAQGERGPVDLKIQAATFDSYAHRRLLAADRTYTGVDQGVLIPDLWRAIQTDPRGNIGVQADDQPTGVLRDRKYLASEVAFVGRLVEDLGDVIDGPEHTIDTYVDETGARRKRLRVAQRIGLTEPRAVFQRASRGGGRVLSWGHAADAVSAGTTFLVRGDAPDGGTPALSSWLTADDLLTAGWPLLDLTEDRAGTSDPATLNGWAATLRAARTGATRTNAFTVSVGETGWSPNRLGDTVRIKQDDAWHNQPEDVDQVIRPVGVKVTPSSTGTDERLELLFGDGA